MTNLFDKHKALIITFLFMGVLILSLNIIALSNKSAAQKELFLELSALDDMEEQLPEKIPEPVLEPKKSSPINKTHRAFNQETKMDQEAFEQRLAALNQKMQTGTESENESVNSESGTEAISKKNADEKKTTSAKKALEKPPTHVNETTNHDSSISYSLIRRKALKLPNPVYTCSNRGKIIVNVVVNQHGHVIEAAINTTASNSNNGCLHDSALKYAKRSQFSISERLQQLGTITYLFNY